MSYQEGWAAINLEMPDKIPRTEYSADRHWKLVEKVTGIAVNESSPISLQQQASSAFYKAWDYGFKWNVPIHNQPLEKCRTKMGHASFAEDGADYSTEVFCPFDDPEDIFDFQPAEVYNVQPHQKLVQDFNEDYAKQCRLAPDAVNTTGIYITLVSGLLEIFGWDMLLMALGIDAEETGHLANRYSEWIQQYFNALADCDAPAVKIYDDIVWTSGSFVSSEWYRKYVFPNYKKLFAPLRESEKKIIYTSDGTYTQFIDDIAECGVNGFVLEPTTDMEYIAENMGKPIALLEMQTQESC